MEKKKKRVGVLALFFIVLTVILICGFLFAPWLKNMVGKWASNKIVTYVASHSDYNLTIDSLSIDGFSTVQLHRVKLENKLGKKDFNVKNKYQTDWILFKTKSICFIGVNWKNWYFDKGILVDEMVVDHPQIEVYRDKRKPREPYVVKPMPTYFLRNAKQILTVPIIRIKEGEVRYEEVVSSGSGKVNFMHIKSSIDNFSTDPLYISNHQDLIMNATADLLDSVKIEINYKAEIQSKMDDFTLKGNAKSIPAPLLNQFLEPLAKFRMKSGLIKKLNFDIKADRNKATGTLDLEYENLKAEVLSKDDPEKESKLKTFIANTFLRDDNKKEDLKKGDYKKGKISYERKKNFSIFNYWLNAVKSGIFTVVTDVDIAKVKKIKSKNKN